MASVWKLKCPVHGEIITSDKLIPIGRDGMLSNEPLFYCEKCGIYYIHTDAVQPGAAFDYGSNKVINVHGEPIKDSAVHYSLDSIRPNGGKGSCRTAPGSYEECEKEYYKGLPFSLLHYAFCYRRFDVAAKIMEALSEHEIAKALHFEGSGQFSWITPLVCAKWNLNYMEAYDDKNGTKLCEKLAPFLDEVGHIDEIMEYTDSVDAEGNHLFGIFWNGRQPILDVVCYEKQKLASAQVEKNGFSVVMDEVGTGKTVSALYAIRNAIQEKIDTSGQAKILVVCPYNKREDWQGDIRRQLGRYAHIVGQGDNGEMYEGNLKRVFFKKDEHLIFITGQKQGADKNGPHSALKGSLETYAGSNPWDLVIIDEAHISFPNYFAIRSNKVMLLTATPIVVNAKGKRGFDDYLGLVSEIMGKSHPATNPIHPIQKAEPTLEDVYVNWFREDMEKQSAERKIRFVPCKRWKERDDVYYQIKEEKGTLAALQYDQDDDYLYWAATEQYGFSNIHEVRKNGKAEKLIALLHENEKSYIVFCEHKFVVDALFTRIKDEFQGCVAAEKYGNYENQYGLENVQDGQLIPSLMQALRSGQRAILVTTGKTGGTGLNLGEFDGVIHYELPFTSMELEQRFGRVDRIDTHRADRARDMIFLLNACRPDENDMEINRMLYYCTTKIDITCQFLPIRNTVLYYPEFIKRNGKAIRDSLECFQKEYVLSEENEKRMKELRRNIRQFEKQIKESPSWHLIEPYARNLRLSAVEALSREKDDKIDEAYYGLLSSYLSYWQDTKPERIAYQKMYRLFLEAKKNADNWMAIAGLIQLDETSDVFVGTESSDDGEEKQIHVAEPAFAQRATGKAKSIQRQISEMIQLIDESVFDEEKLKSFSAEGIFCYKDHRIHRSSVKEYRQGNTWK